jgi:hypothetical protein
MSTSRKDINRISRVCPKTTAIRAKKDFTKLLGRGSLDVA